LKKSTFSSCGGGKGRIKAFAVVAITLKPSIELLARAVGVVSESEVLLKVSKLVGRAVAVRKPKAEAVRAF
jgi:hypothetical protein